MTLQIWEEYSTSGAAPLPDSFTEVELLIAGDATSYAPLASLTADGFWTFEEDTQQSYKIRVVVRYPPAELFSGVVVSEWMNVTAGVDNSVDCAFLSEEIGRRRLSAFLHSLLASWAETLAEFQVA